MARRVVEPEWLTPAQVAARFNVDRHAVTRWAKAGTIPPEHVIRTPAEGGTGHLRIRAAWVDAYLNGGRS